MAMAFMLLFFVATFALGVVGYKLYQARRKLHQSILQVGNAHRREENGNPRIDQANGSEGNVYS